MSRLEIIMGCMFSGKSTELVRRLKRYKAIGEDVLVINSSTDTRSTENVVKTHDGVTFDCIKTDKLKNIFSEPSFLNSKIIGIDEGQFFGDLYDFVYITLQNYEKHIIIASLDGDSNQKVFGQTLMLIPLADDVDKLKALCMECNDGTPAPFSKRLISTDKQSVVGANDIYRAVCRKHLEDPIIDKLISETVGGRIFSA
jgi:thymidine kinase